MGTFVVKISDDNSRLYKLVDQVSIGEYNEIKLDDAIPYDANNTEAGQWFYVENSEVLECSYPMLNQSFDVVDLISITSNQFSGHGIDFIAYFDNERYYIQKITKGSFLKKKWLSLNGNVVKYSENDDVVYINPIPNCIYESKSHRVYFMDIAKAYSVFPFLKLDYKEATKHDIEQILQSDMIRIEGGFKADDVGLTNRKRIASILTKFNDYDKADKESLRKYIREKTGGELPFNEGDNKFVIVNDSQLRLFLYGVQQRFYQPPLENEVQVATATTKLSNLL